MLRSSYVNAAASALRQLRIVVASPAAGSRAYASDAGKGKGKGELTNLKDSDLTKLDIKDITNPQPPKAPFPVSADESADLSGVPEEHLYGRRARIYSPPRLTTQAGWKNASGWKIGLDTRERWENPLIGYCSSGDPLSNIEMQLNFATKEDAIAFCEKNRWTWEIEEPNERQIKPKNYGSNFAWNKRSRVSTK